MVSQSDFVGRGVDIELDELIPFNGVVFVACFPCRKARKMKKQLFPVADQVGHATKPHSTGLFPFFRLDLQERKPKIIAVAVIFLRQKA